MAADLFIIFFVVRRVQRKAFAPVKTVSSSSSGVVYLVVVQASVRRINERPVY